MNALAINGLAFRDRHSTERTAVVSALHSDNILLSRGHSRRLYGSFNGLGTRVPEEERVERGIRHNRK